MAIIDSLVVSVKLIDFRDGKTELTDLADALEKMLDKAEKKGRKDMRAMILEELRKLFAYYCAVDKDQIFAQIEKLDV